MPYVPISSQLEQNMRKAMMGSMVADIERNGVH